MAAVVKLDAAMSPLYPSTIKDFQLSKNVGNEKQAMQLVIKDYRLVMCIKLTICSKHY